MKSDRPSRTEFDQFIEQSKSYVSQATVENYRYAMNDFLLWLERRPVTPGNIDAWTTHLLLTKRLRSTAVAYRASLRAFFEWKIRNYTWTLANPVWPMRNSATKTEKKAREVFEEHEYSAILEHVRGTFWELMIVLAWNTGLRLSDCALLQWRNVHLEEQVLRVIPKKTSKTGKFVSIPFGEELAKLLIEQPRDGKYVIPKASVHYLFDQHKSLSAAFGTILDQCKIEGKSFHSFRHSFVSRHLAAGVSPAKLAAITGHSLNMMMNYAHFKDDDLRESLGIKKPQSQELQPA